MSTATMPALVRDLQEGDCFFYTSPEEYAARYNRIEEFNALRGQVGEQPISPKEAAVLIQATAETHVVLTIVRDTSERVSLRPSDGKKFIWYGNDAFCRVASNRDAAERYIAEMRAARKKMDDEEARLRRPHGKKRNAPVEIAERTLVAGR